MRDTAHNIMVREGGACPWCGGTAIFTTRECPEPDGAAEAYDPWDDPEEEEDADALVLMALTWGDELRAIRTAQVDDAPEDHAGEVV